MSKETLTAAIMSVIPLMVSNIGPDVPAVLYGHPT
jgi:hypothetical protein